MLTLIFRLDFKKIVQNDQIVLIKAHFFKVWLLRISCMFSNDLDAIKQTNEPNLDENLIGNNIGLTFDSGYCITKQQLELVYGVSSWPFNLIKIASIFIDFILILFKVQFVKNMIDFSQSFCSLKLNDIEIGLICAILFTSINGMAISNYLLLYFPNKIIFFNSFRSKSKPNGRVPEQADY